VQQQNTVLLPNSLDSSSSTPTAYPIATMLSNSLLQALGSPLIPGSPHVLPAVADQASGAEQQQQQHTNLTLDAHTAAAPPPAAPAPTQQQMRDSMVQACVATGMCTEDAQVLVDVLISQPGLSINDLLALLHHMPHCFATNDSLDEMQQLLVGSTSDNIMAAQSLPGLLLPHGMEALPVLSNGGPSNRSSSTSIGSSGMSSSSLPVCNNSDVLSSNQSGILSGQGEVCAKAAHTGVFSRMNSGYECTWEEGGEGNTGGNSAMLHDPVAPNPAAQAPSPLPYSSFLPRPPATSPMTWGFPDLMGSAGRAQELGAPHHQAGQLSAYPSSHSLDRGLSQHGGQQLLSWMDQQQQQQQQQQAPSHDSASYLQDLHVHAPSPTFRSPNARR
jgi:hypothetical protein